jgi:KDO2-lipid IV(A) lauroyltransferase
MTAPAANPRRAEVVSDYPPPFSAGLLAPRFWPTWLGLGVLRVLAFLPAAVRARLGDWLGDLIFTYHGKRRRIVLTNLAWCFPDRDEAARREMARAYSRHMARTFIDYGVLWWGSERRLGRMLRLDGEENLRRCVEAGQPVILLTCHNAALDFGAAALTRFYPSVGLIKEARNPLIDWVMARGRTRFQGILYRREQGMRPVVRAIRAGHAFYYLPDEDLGPENSVFVPFFGVETATITALSRLTRMCRAAVLPYTTCYNAEERRYVARIFPPLAAFPGEDEVADAARMNRELERLVRLAPEQYMWSLRIFQTRPEGEHNPYKRRRAEVG